MTAMQPDDILLATHAVKAGYGDVQVLGGVDLDVRAGQITLLLGRNGAGKTTLLRSLAGLNAIRSGTLRFRGQDLTRAPAHVRVGRGLALVQEGKRLFHQRTVEENLMLGGLTLGKSRRELQQLAAEVYDRFPILGDKRRDRCGTLSGGQQQMVAIGQAVIRKPALLMLDEPSAGLAPVISRQVLDALTTLRAEGVAVLLVEQAAELAMPHADHVYVLDLGRIVLDEPAGNVPDLEVIRDIYLSRRNIAATADAKNA
jgi:branched-chain amino acid transport system ATP-binding protein